MSEPEHAYSRDGGLGVIRCVCGHEVKIGSDSDVSFAIACTEMNDHIRANTPDWDEVVKRSTHARLRHDGSIEKLDKN